MHHRPKNLRCRAVVKIGPASLRDVPGIMRLQELTSIELRKGKLTREKAASIAVRYSHFLVAKSRGKIVAVRGMFPEERVSYIGPDSKEHSVLTTVLANAFTLPDYRHQGISSRLFDAILEKARSEGKKELYVAAEGKGTPGFWEKRGFEKVGTCTTCERFLQGKCTAVPMYRKSI